MVEKACHVHLEASCPVDLEEHQKEVVAFLKEDQ